MVIIRAERSYIESCDGRTNIDSDDSEVIDTCKYFNVTHVHVIFIDLKSKVPPYYYSLLSSKSKTSEAVQH